MLNISLCSVCRIHTPLPCFKISTGIYGYTNESYYSMKVVESESPRNYNLHRAANNGYIRKIENKVTEKCLLKCHIKYLNKT